MDVYSPNRDNARQLNLPDIRNAALKMLQHPATKNLTRRAMAEILGCGSSSIQRAADSLLGQVIKTTPQPPPPLETAVKKLVEARESLKGEHPVMAQKISSLIEELEKSKG